MRTVVCAIVLSLAIFHAGCTYGTREGTVQKDDASSIRFTGNPIGVEIQVDDGRRILIAEEDSDEFDAFKPRQLYRVTPGKHTVKVYRNSEKVVDKTIYVGTGEIKEIAIP